MIVDLTTSERETVNAAVVKLDGEWGNERKINVIIPPIENCTPNHHVNTNIVLQPLIGTEIEMVTLNIITTVPTAVQDVYSVVNPYSSLRSTFCDQVIVISCRNRKE